MVKSAMAAFYLELSENPLRFPPVSREVNVFFDECNKQVFAVAQENRFTRVHVKGPESLLNIDFQVSMISHTVHGQFVFCALL